MDNIGFNEAMRERRRMPVNPGVRSFLLQTENRGGGVMKQPRMNRAVLENIELEYEIVGAAEPVVLIHPGHFADWFTPLLGEPLTPPPRFSVGQVTSPARTRGSHHCLPLA